MKKDGLRCRMWVDEYEKRRTAHAFFASVLFLSPETGHLQRTVCIDDIFVLTTIGLI
jgi:hypothetical protein